MSTHAYDEKCPKCGQDMDAGSDSRPYVTVFGSCAYCGFQYWTQEGRMTLNELNEYRADNELEPLDKLPKITIDV